MFVPESQLPEWWVQSGAYEYLKQQRMLIPMVLHAASMLLTSISFMKLHRRPKRRLSSNRVGRLSYYCIHVLVLFFSLASLDMGLMFAGTSLMFALFSLIVAFSGYYTRRTLGRRLKEDIELAKEQYTHSVADSYEFTKTSYSGKVSSEQLTNQIEELFIELRPVLEEVVVETHWEPSTRHRPQSERVQMIVNRVLDNENAPSVRTGH